jgi:fucose permease
LVSCLEPPVDARLFPFLLLFFVMGFGDLRAALVGFLPAHFQISTAQAGLLPFCGAISFALFSLPWAILAQRFGKVRLLQGALFLVLAGHLLPLVNLSSYGNLLLATFLAGIGITGLQVAGPALLGERSGFERYARNQVLAQFIQSLGSMSGPYLLAILVGLGLSWWSVYPGFALIVLAAWATFHQGLREPGLRPPEAGIQAPAGRQLRGLLSDRGILMPTAGTFLFVGAEGGLAAWIASFLAETHGMTLGADATLWGPALFFFAQAAGRVLGVAALHAISSRELLLVSSTLGTAGTLGLMVGGKLLAVASVGLCGLGSATIWPILFALTLEHRPRRGTQVAGLMAMANCAGALFPPCMGAIGDRAGLRWALLVPLAALSAVALLATAALLAPRILGWKARPPQHP